MHTNTVLSLFAPMESPGGFSLNFSHIQQTIRKSKCSLLSVLNVVSLIKLYIHRVLLATIRQLAKCPCPCCLIEQRWINGIGTHVDDQRQSHLQTDTKQHRQRVETSHFWIYQKGKGVKSQCVEDLLHEKSYTPTQVR